MPAQISIVQLVASAARTTQGVSGSAPGAAGVLDCDGYACLGALLSVTTGGLTVTSFRVWFEGTLDYGATWFGLVHTNVMKINNQGVLNAAAGNLTSNAASLVAEVANVTGTTAYIGCVNNPPPFVRAAWEINGTTPSETFSIMAYLSRAQSN
jgi:hypothetical protein